MGKIVISICFLLLLCGGCSQSLKDVAIYGRIVGETITMIDEHPTALYKQKQHPTTVKIYSRNPSGYNNFYTEGVDYIITSNGIQRTQSSTIPNRANHEVVYNSDGTFTWNIDPSNPEKMLQYQVYADYTYDASMDKKSVADNNISAFISSRIAQNHSLKLACVGTSISYGGDTFARTYSNSNSECYWALAAKALCDLYKTKCVGHDYSISGGSSDQLLSSINKIVELNPDIVLIEYGMNDHLHKYNEDLFRNNIEQTVCALKEKDIAVIIVGFFQQNKKWDLEKPDLTLSFNNILSEIAAKNNVPFVDIYEQFAKVTYDKAITDFIADYIHHPSSFGHQLYYLALMPILAPKPVADFELFCSINK